MIRIYYDSPFIEYRLNTEPTDYLKRSFELMANFRILNFGNEGVFYTDSNGLSMMKRERSY